MSISDDNPTNSFTFGGGTNEATRMLAPVLALHANVWVCVPARPQSFHDKFIPVADATSAHSTSRAAGRSLFIAAFGDTARTRGGAVRVAKGQPRNYRGHHKHSMSTGAGPPPIFPFPVSVFSPNLDLSG